MLIVRSPFHPFLPAFSALLVASGLPQSKIEELADTIQGAGIKPPKEKLLAKVAERVAESESA